MADMLESLDALDTVEALKEGSPDPKHLSLEALILLLNAERLRYLENKSFNELDSLRKRQGDVSTIHDIMKKINKLVDDKGAVDLSGDESIAALLEKAKELGIEHPGKNKLSKEERERLMENLKMTAEDLNVLNDMQLQKVTRFTNERYESYQMARSILKPLHDDKVNKARAIAGR